MTLSPQMENAWTADEGLRFSANVLKQEEANERLNRNLIRDERGLPEYERPIKYIPRVRKPLGERITNFVKQLVP